MSEERFTCEVCDGDGKSYNSRGVCYGCNGRGYITDPAQLEIQRRSNEHMMRILNRRVSEWA
jgi:RecJ-like exonuclease